MKIHKVLSQGSSFIKTCEIDSSSTNNLTWGGTINLFILKFIQSKYNPKSHTNWQTRRNRDSNQINYLHYQIMYGNYIM